MIERKDLLELYQNFEISRLKLIDTIAYDMAVEKLKNGDEYTMGVINGSAFWNGKVLKLSIKDFIPSNKVVGEMKGKILSETRSYWKSTIFSLYKSTGIDLKFEKAHCHIAMFLPYKIPWDIDNRTFSFIINGVRSCRMIKDDSSKYLEFSLSGHFDKVNPRTEIYITDANDLELYNQLSKDFA